MLLPLSTQSEPYQLVHEVESLLSAANRVATTEREHTRAERLRQSILKKAFSGRLVPHEEGASPPSIDGTASKESDTGSGNHADSDVEDLMGSADPSKQIEMDLFCISNVGQLRSSRAAEFCLTLTSTPSHRWKRNNWISPNGQTMHSA